jgi:DNA-directed RNA polymerase subunit RPC12/RpoP
MRDIVKSINVKCPYCGHKNGLFTSEEGKRIFNCEGESGGCDRNFVISLKATIKVEIFLLEPVAGGDKPECWYCDHHYRGEVCPRCNKPADPKYQLRTPYNFCPDCNSPKVYPASFAPKMYHCHNCDLEYEPEKFIEGKEDLQRLILCWNCGGVRLRKKDKEPCPHCGQPEVPF